MPEDRPPSIMRALGLAVGDLWRTVTGSGPVRRTEARREVEERAEEGGRVVLRRTTIEEVEVRADGADRPY